MIFFNFMEYLTAFHGIKWEKFYPSTFLKENSKDLFYPSIFLKKISKNLDFFKDFFWEPKNHIFSKEISRTNIVNCLKEFLIFSHILWIL